MFSAMPDADRKLQTLPSDPDGLAKLLEIELMQKRARWQQTKVRNRSFRALAFLFLVLVVAGALAAYFFFLSNAPQPRAAESPTSKAAAAGANR